MKLSKLLLVEDNQEAADLLIGILEYAGHKVVHKLNGIEGLKAAQTETFDGILLDYMLPDMEGLQLSWMIRKFAHDVPIILTTAYVDKITQEDLQTSGVTAFVPKPVSLNLLQVIKEHVTSQSLSAKPKEGLLQSLYHTVFGDDEDENEYYG